MIRSKRLARSCPRLPNGVTRGEWAEAAFLTRALGLGFTVCRPFCGTQPFDFLVVRVDGSACRVQVKSCWREADEWGYRLTLGHHGRRYRWREVDVIAGYVAAEEAWYIIPVRGLRNCSVSLFPHIVRSRSRWERYREAWHLLQPSPGHPSGK